MDALTLKKRKFTRIILAYPVALILIALLANLFLFGVTPATIALPDTEVLAPLVISALVLLGLHTWLMTSTELTRLHHDLHATPEEWEASDHAPEDISAKAQHELKRRHNAHTNMTENTLHFAILAILLALVSPAPLAAQVWSLAFAAGRFGHCFAYLSGQDSLRGIAMSLSLLSLYGMASYLAISLMI